MCFDFLMHSKNRVTIAQNCLTYSSNLNRYIGEIDHVLMQATNKAVITNDASAKAYLTFKKEGTEGYEAVETVTGDNATVGYFDYLGDTVLFVLNCNIQSEQEITIQLDSDYTYTYTQQNGTEGAENGDNIGLTIPAGESALIVLK